MDRRTASRSEFVYTFSGDIYPIRESVAKALNCKAEELKQIHTLAPELPQLTFEGDTRTPFHRQFYSSAEFPNVVTLYQRLVKEAILPILADETGEAEFLVQREPSFRIHLPNNTALGVRAGEDAAEASEQIGLHCDADYNHPSAEINFVLTITGQAGTNSFYVESAPGKGDYLPIALSYGEMLRFYGNQCRHYNRINRTGATRISLDFRVIPGAVAAPREAAVHSGRPFTAEEGGYYVRMHAPP